MNQGEISYGWGRFRFKSTWILSYLTYILEIFFFSKPMYVPSTVQVILPCIILFNTENIQITWVLYYAHFPVEETKA